MDEEATSQTQDDVQELEQSTSEEHLNEEVSEESAETEEAEQEEQESEEEQPELTPRQQRRVEQIEDQAKELKLNKILDRIQNVRTQPAKRSSSLDYREAIEADDAVYDTLEKDRSSYGEQRYNEGLEMVKAMEFKTNIKLDLPLVKDKLDKLDPADAAAIDREYLMYTGWDAATQTVKNPDIGYADFVEAQIERAERLASNLHVASQKNIAKQAAQTGIRPDGGARKGINIQNPGDISKLTPEQFEKNREAIYKQLGLSTK